MRVPQPKWNMLRLSAGVLAILCLTSCMGGVADIPFEETFPWEMPEEEDEQMELTPNEDVEEEVEAPKTPLGPTIRIPIYMETHKVELPQVLNSPAKVRCYRSLAFDLRGTVLACTFYERCILLEEIYRFEEHGKSHVLHEYFFCPNGEQYYGYYRGRNHGDEDFSSYEHIWTFDSYEQVVEFVLNDTSGEVPSLARHCGIDQNAAYQKSVELKIEYGPGFCDQMNVDIYELDDPEFGKILYLANADTHLLERVIFLKEEMHGGYPVGWEDMTAAEQSRFHAEVDEVRDILPSDWREWTPWELYRASMEVCSSRFDYGPQLKGISGCNSPEQLEDWNYRLKILRRLPKN